MLGAGFFATQKSQEVTYSGIKQSTSNLVIDGQLYGSWSGTALNTVTMTLAIPEGGQPQDGKLIDFVVTVNGAIVTPTNYDFAVTGTNTWVDQASLTSSSIPPDVIASGGKVDVRLTFAGPARGGSFTIEVKPSVGAASLVSKTISTGWNGGVII